MNPQNSRYSDAHIIRKVLHYFIPIILAGVLLGIVGFIFPSGVPFTALFAGIILPVYSLRVIEPMHYWQILIMILGILVICCVTANLSHGMFCSSQLMIILQNFNITPNCTSNSSGATTFGVLWFMGISCIGMLVIMLFSRNK